MSVEQIDWHALTEAETERRLGSDARGGLAQDVARERLAQMGPNRPVVPQGMRILGLLLRQFRSALVLILGVAAVVSLAVGEVLDALVIAVILVLNALFGFIQEWRAERALAALRHVLTVRARVVREGLELELDACELVPGDLVRLEAGDRVPADLRLCGAEQPLVDESALTGESFPVQKDSAPAAAATPLAERSCMAWTGTLVLAGSGCGLVAATGNSTQFGRIAELTRTAERAPTPLQRRLTKLGRQLVLAALGTATTVVLIGVLLGRPLLEMFLTGVSFAVALVPEGLPAVVTLTLALGVRQMVRRRALPRTLQAAETLGSATVVLTDKTGTLTSNVMTVAELWLPSGELRVRSGDERERTAFEDDGRARSPSEHPELRRLLHAVAHCTDADARRVGDHWERIGDPTESALALLVAQSLDESAAVEALGARERDLPFDRHRKRRSTVFTDGGQTWIASKGAPELLLPLCDRVASGSGEVPLSPEARAQVIAGYERLADAGMRTLAVGVRQLPEDSDPQALNEGQLERELTLLGFTGIHDPPRPEVASAITRALAAGIATRMATGDAPNTALAIAARIGLPVESAITGAELEALDAQQLDSLLEGSVLFARVTPEQKLLVARAFKRRGEIVAMTGDGINDAPALREADVGVAMGLRGTEVAREAADLVLLDDNFATLVDAVEEGRREYDNVRKFVRYLLSSNVGEAVALFVTLPLAGPLILIPVQILWINVVTDAVTALSLGLEPPEQDSMRRPPRPPEEPILEARSVLRVAALGGYIGLSSAGLYVYYLRREDPQSMQIAGTVAFTSIVVLEQLNLFNHRTLRGPIAAIGWLSNPWLLVALAATFGLQLAAVYTPLLQRALHTSALGWADWGRILAVALPVFLIPEALELWRARRDSRTV